MRSSPSLPTALAALALVAVLAACGSSAPDADRSTTTGARPTTTVEGTSTSTAPTTTHPEPEPTGSTTTAVVPVEDEFCGVLGDYIEANASEFDPGDPAGYERATKVMRKRGDVLLSEAPAEIRPAIEVVIDAQDQLIAALEAVDYHLAELDLEALSVLDSPEVDEAFNQVQAYAKDPCGLDVSGPSTGVSNGPVVVD